MAIWLNPNWWIYPAVNDFHIHGGRDNGNWWNALPTNPDML